MNDSQSDRQGNSLKALLALSVSGSSPSAARHCRVRVYLNWSLLLAAPGLVYMSAWQMERTDRPASRSLSCPASVCPSHALPVWRVCAHFHSLLLSAGLQLQSSVSVSQFTSLMRNIWSDCACNILLTYILDFFRCVGYIQWVCKYNDKQHFG